MMCWLQEVYKHSLVNKEFPKASQDINFVRRGENKHNRRKGKANIVEGFGREGKRVECLMGVFIVRYSINTEPFRFCSATN